MKIDTSWNDLRIMFVLMIVDVAIVIIVVLVVVLVVVEVVMTRVVVTMVEVVVEDNKTQQKHVKINKNQCNQAYLAMF